MRKFTLYHNSECSKSNEVLKLLEAAKVEFDMIEYLDEPPSVATLDTLLRQLKMEPKDLVRRSEDEYTMLKLGLQPPKSRDAWLKIFSQYPILIERPIVTDGLSAVIGRPPQKVIDWVNSKPSLTPWTEADKQRWFLEQTIKRSYLSDVVSQIEALRSSFEVIQYGALSLNPAAYPLFLIRSKDFKANRKTILITGGVHGYETSGVQGALSFLKNEAAKFGEQFNFICAPCISPWAYETINRWNPKAIDPNRSFIVNSPAEECALFLNAIAGDQSTIYAHFDLHETTDTDNTVFRPALEKRDGKVKEWSEIPDGFYAVGDTENPCREFQKAIIDSVKTVTHIAPADKNGKLIGVPLEQEGVINYPVKKLSLLIAAVDQEAEWDSACNYDRPRLKLLK